MIRILLTKYWVLAHLLLVAGTLCFVPNLSAWFALWAAGSLLLFARFLPPVLKGEGFWAARTRVDRAMGGDILTWSDVVEWLGNAKASYVNPDSNLKWRATGIQISVKETRYAEVSKTFEGAYWYPEALYGSKSSSGSQETT